MRRQRYCLDLLYRGRAEQSYTTTHTATGIEVKLRPELAHFLTTIEKYDYDRQAALYLDVPGATRFLIIGVQKKDPHNIWRVELTATPGLIEQGRKKYGTLLRHFAARAAVAAIRCPTTQPFAALAA